jgi:hypothetical protein
MEYCIQNIIDCGVQCQSVADRQAQLKNETDMTPEAAQSKNEQLQAELQSAEQQYNDSYVPENLNSWSLMSCLFQMGDTLCVAASNDSATVR